MSNTDGSAPAAPVGRVDRPTHPAPTERLHWADAAKGVCIVLVVLWHVVHKDLAAHAWAEGRATQLWQLATLWFVPLRMPLFFVVSGLFAASAMRRRWAVVLRDRSIKLYWLFALWVVIQIPVFLAVPSFPTGRVESFGGLVRALTIEPPNVWYLYALALYVVVARLTVRVPTAALLVPALLLSSVAATGVFPLTENTSGILQYFFFFVVGLRLRVLVLGVAEAADGRRLVASASVFGAGATVLLFGPGPWVDLAEPLVGLSAVHAATTAAALVSRVRWIESPLAALGRRTLPVYVVHLPLVVLLFLVGEHVDLGPVAFAYPVVATAAVCLAAVGLERALRAAGLGEWLFDLPRPIAQRLTPPPPAAPRV